MRILMFESIFEWRFFMSKFRASANVFLVVQKKSLTRISLLKQRQRISLLQNNKNSFESSSFSRRKQKFALKINVHSSSPVKALLVYKLVAQPPRAIFLIKNYPERTKSVWLKSGWDARVERISGWTEAICRRMRMKTETVKCDRGKGKMRKVENKKETVNLPTRETRTADNNVWAQINCFVSLWNF